MSQKTFRAFPFFSGSTQYSPSVLKCPAFRISLQDEAGWWEYKPSEKENLYNYVIPFYALRCIPNLEVHTKNTLLLLTVVWLTSFTIVSWVTQSALSLSFLITGNVDTGNLCVWKLSKLHQKTIFFSCCLRKTLDRREDPTIYICSKTRFFCGQTQVKMTQRCEDIKPRVDFITGGALSGVIFFRKTPVTG